MNKGDKVKLKDQPNITGEITDIRQIDVWGAMYGEYLVKYDSDSIGPNPSWHGYEELELITKLMSGMAIDTTPKPLVKKSIANGCECGAAYDRDFPDVHSSWCPKYRRY